MIRHNAPRQQIVLPSRVKQQRVADKRRELRVGQDWIRPILVQIPFQDRPPFALNLAGGTALLSHTLFHAADFRLGLLKQTLRQRTRDAERNEVGGVWLLPVRQSSPIETVAFTHDRSE
jgi:hypothetical protein